MNKYGSSPVNKSYALSSGNHVRTGKSGNSSEEMILPIQGEGELGNIMKTTVFTVISDEERTAGGDGNGRQSCVEPQWPVGEKV
jgi:hypothetical protein